MRVTGWLHRRMQMASISLPLVRFGPVVRYVAIFFLQMPLISAHYNFSCFTDLYFSQRRFAHVQVRNCYTSLSEQFDTLLAGQVIWEPYTQASIAKRYPDGISYLCTRDMAYWMTKSKIIFDVEVEEMSQQRVMRQFGLRQYADPPPMENQFGSSYIHRYVH